MMWRNKNTKSATPRPGLFDKLIDDVLRLVIQEISVVEGKAGLLNVCLVSRHLYLRTVPHLYREILFDLTKASHRRLLERLAIANSQTAAVIRVLGISGSGVLGPYSISYHQVFDTPKKTLVGMSLEVLTAAKTKRFIGNLGWDRKGYGKEIKRHVKNDSATATATEYSTLYDAWA